MTAPGEKTIQPRPDRAAWGWDSRVNAYIFWGIVIAVCFYLGARLTFQTREKKRSMLRLNFEEAKKREKKRGG